MNDRDKLAIGPVSIEGQAGAIDGIVGIVRDIFSPLSEGLGLIGDRIRIYRAQSLERVLSRARDISRSEGVELQPPPVKFLIPFMEGASLEDADQPNELMEMWAQLLVSSGSQYTSTHNRYVRILEQITQLEAKMLQDMVSIDDISPDDDLLWDIRMGLGKHLSLSLEQAFRSASNVGTEEGRKEFFETLQKFIDIPCVSPVYARVIEKTTRETDQVYLDDYIDDPVYEVLNPLVAEGLIVEFDYSVNSPGYIVSINCYYVTHLGFSLLLACTPKGRVLSAAYENELSKWRS